LKKADGVSKEDTLGKRSLTCGKRKKGGMPRLSELKVNIYGVKGTASYLEE